MGATIGLGLALTISFVAVLIGRFAGSAPESAFQYYGRAEANR